MFFQSCVSPPPSVSPPPPLAPVSPPQVEDEAEPGLLFPDDVRSVQRNLLRPGEDHMTHIPGWPGPPTSRWTLNTRTQQTATVLDTVQGYGDAVGPDTIVDETLGVVSTSEAESHQSARR